MPDTFPFSFLSSAQCRFINLCSFAYCSRAKYWQEKDTLDIFCDNCFYSEPIINRDNCRFAISHILVIYVIQLKVKCHLCRKSLAVQCPASNCDTCWDILPSVWARLSETEKKEIESFTEPAFLYITATRLDYQDRAR